MSKENFDAEIQEHIAKAMKGIREEMDANYIHDVILDNDELAQGFMLGAVRLAKKLGFDDAKLKSLAKYNKKELWLKAILEVNAKILGKTFVQKGQQFNKLKSIRKMTNFIGVYLMYKDNSTMTLRFYNKQAGSSVHNSYKWSNFNRRYRRWVWNEWFDINEFKGGAGLEKIPKLNYKGKKTEEYSKDARGTAQTIGSALPYAHETTVGMEAIGGLKDALELDQSLEAYDGVFAKDQHTLDLWTAVEQSLEVDWEEEWVVNLETGELELVRVVKGKLVQQPKNLSNSQKGDWINIRKDVIEKLHAFLKEAKPVKGLSAVDFSASVPFRQQAVRAAQYKLLRDLMKRNRGRVTVKKIKPFKKPKNRKGTVGKSKSGGGTRGGPIRVKDIGSARPRKGAEKGTGREASTNVAADLARLRTYIQSRLPAEVRRNMGNPALRNRTGRFSNSVQLLSLQQAQNTVMAKYTYLLSPYQTFENTGKKRWPMAYNPKPLIAKSIRNLALGRMEQKLTVRRV